MHVVGFGVSCWFVLAAGRIEKLKNSSRPKMAGEYCIECGHLFSVLTNVAPPSIRRPSLPSTPKQ